MTKPSELPIAVLSCDFALTLEWLRKNFDVAFVRVHNRYIRTKTGQEFYVIDREEQALGMWFSNYIKAPDYHSLEDVVRYRINQLDKKPDKK